MSGDAGLLVALGVFVLGHLITLLGICFVFDMHRGGVGSGVGYFLLFAIPLHIMFALAWGYLWKWLYLLLFGLIVPFLLDDPQGRRLERIRRFLRDRDLMARRQALAVRA
jgi:hypothetical protein